MYRPTWCNIVEEESSTAPFWRHHVSQICSAVSNSQLVIIFPNFTGLHIRSYNYCKWLFSHKSCGEFEGYPRCITSISQMIVRGQKYLNSRMWPKTLLTAHPFHWSSLSPVATHTDWWCSKLSDILTFPFVDKHRGTNTGAERGSFCRTHSGKIENEDSMVSISTSCPLTYSML